MVIPRTITLLGGFLFFCALAAPLGQPAPAAQSNDPVAQAIAEGDAYQSKRDYEQALKSYWKADKLSHHTSALALLHIAVIEKKAGVLWDAASDAKKAIAAAGDNKTLEWQARLLRATLLTQMAGKPNDKKLQDAEAELRAAVQIDPSQPIAHYNLGFVLLKQERDADGIAELNALLALPKTDAAMAADARRMIASPIRARTPFLPSFSFITRENQAVSNLSVRGKVTLLDFWGTWCPPCRESVPILRNLQKKYAAKAFLLVSISSDEDEDAWKNFVEAQHMEWSEYLDSSGQVQQAFKIDSFPTFIVVDKDGVIRFRQSGVGSDTQGDLEDAINHALKRESDPVLAKAAAEEANAAPAADHAPPVNAGKSSKPNDNARTPVSDAAAASIASTLRPTVAAPAANVYKNARLGMRYEFPEGWIAAQPEDLLAANQHIEASMRDLLLKQQAQASDSIQILPPTILFYASRRGDGEPEKPVMSSISIRAQQTNVDPLDEARFRAMTDKMINAGQMKLLAPAAGFEVAGHKFLRADFERSIGAAIHYFIGIVETSAGGSLLHIEIYAASPEELRQIADTLQTMKIENDE
jgi:thiol-disulfide isomerase/thioredoxin